MIGIDWKWFPFWLDDAATATATAAAAAVVAVRWLIAVSKSGEELDEKENEEVRSINPQQRPARERTMCVTAGKVQNMPTNKQAKNNQQLLHPATRKPKQQNRNSMQRIINSARVRSRKSEW